MKLSRKSLRTILSAAVASALLSAPMTVPTAGAQPVPPPPPTPQSILSGQALDNAVRYGLANAAADEEWDPTGFYASIPADVQGAPGTVLKTQPATFFVEKTAMTLGTQATRFVYISRDTHDRPIPVTGMLVTPSTPWMGPGPRPLMVLAPGTQGNGDRCAPTKLLEQAKEYESLTMAPLLQRGYSVVITDYEGVGTPGTPTYMNRKSQAHTTLDVARAAKNLGNPEVSTDAPVGIWGFSQGGGAAAAAAELHGSYAPDVNLKGVFAGDIPANLAATAKHIDGSALSAAILYTINGITYAYPKYQELIGRFLTPAGQAALDSVKNTCETGDLFEWGGKQTNEFTVDGRKVGAYLDDPEIKKVLDQQLIGTIKPDVPVYVTHNVKDDLVPIEQGRNLVNSWCAKGAKVNYVEYDVGPIAPVVDHSLADAFSIVPAGDWLHQALIGNPVPLTCNG